MRRQRFRRTLGDRKWVKLTWLTRFESLFSLDPCVDNVFDNPGDRKWVEFSSVLLYYIAVFSRSTFQNISDRAADPKVSEIHFSVSSRKPLSFLDPWSTVFCIFWLMERRMGSPLLSTKLSSRLPTTDAPSTANIRQSSDMLWTCLSSWRSSSQQKWSLFARMVR